MNTHRRARTRTAALVMGGAAVLVAAVLHSPTATAVAADPVCGTTGVSLTDARVGAACTWTTPGTDTFAVPAVVSSVTVDLYGAEGGSAAGYVSPDPPRPGAPGGLGGHTRATLAVTPGQTLQLTVGAAGIPGSSRHGEYARPGGYGHGAGGGGAHGGGGSGGGASDLRVGAFGPADRVLVAGGGGGAGNGGPALHGGDVVLLDGDTPLGTVPLTGGRAVLRTPVLRPGSHTITARYEGDLLHHPGSTPQPLMLTVGFSRPCRTGTHEGPLTVPAGESLCLAAGARQNGPVRIEPGGALAASGAVFNGPFTADGALALSLCGTRLDGRFTVRGTVGPFVLCDGSSITGPATLVSNAGGTDLGDTTVTGPLRCEANIPAPDLESLVVRGPRDGQCR
ncbi:Ig-like domain-containing protein [Streptomyces globisporus]|uniref:Ig-like domain-containing protein n=1 Tax=Streptomyces globisporus TaxID=1908 RepID=UPI0004C75EAC|nr:Ig-like domain-containing protein [Streptomyces globisporus]